MWQFLISVIFQTGWNPQCSPVISWPRLGQKCWCIKPVYLIILCILQKRLEQEQKKAKLLEQQKKQGTHVVAYGELIQVLCSPCIMRRRSQHIEEYIFVTLGCFIVLHWYWGKLTACMVPQDKEYLQSLPTS